MFGNLVKHDHHDGEDEGSGVNPTGEPNNPIKKMVDAVSYISAYFGDNPILCSIKQGIKLFALKRFFILHILLNRDGQACWHESNRDPKSESSRSCE